jgi:hypothetical protein
MIFDRYHLARGPVTTVRMCVGVEFLPFLTEGVQLVDRKASPGWILLCGQNRWGRARTCTDSDFG